MKIFTLMFSPPKQENKCLSPIRAKFPAPETLAETRLKGVFSGGYSLPRSFSTIATAQGVTK